MELRCLPNNGFSSDDCSYYDESFRSRTTYLPRNNILTAFYVPSSAEAEFTLVPNFVSSSAGEPRWTERRPDALRQEGLEQCLEESRQFWTGRVSLEKSKFENDATMPVFDRQESFPLDDQEYVRWVPLHPYVPLCDDSYLPRMTLRNVSPEARIFVEVAFPEDAEELLPSVPGATFFLDDQWDKPVCFVPREETKTSIRPWYRLASK